MGLNPVEALNFSGLSSFQLLRAANMAIRPTKAPHILGGGGGGVEVRDLL